MPKERGETDQLLREIEGLRSLVTSLAKRELPDTGQADGSTRPPSETAHRKPDALTLEERERTSRALLNATADSALLIDKNGLIIDANDKMAASLGKSRETILGTVIYNYFPPDLTEQRKAKESEAARDKKLVRFEDYREGRWLENSVYPVFDSKGELVQFAIFSHDISKRKVAEQALQESERYYRTLFESASDAVFIMEENYFLECNQKVLKLFGCTSEQILGKTPADFSPPFQPDGQDSRERAERIMEEVRNGIPQFFEWRHKRHDGGLFDAEVSLDPLNIRNQKRFVAIVRDITERKKSEEALNNALAEVRRMKEAAEAENIYLYKEIQMAHLHGDFIGQSDNPENIVAAGTAFIAGFADSVGF